MGNGAIESVRILIVEDEKDIAESIADGLSLQGYQVKVAADGQSAIRALNLEWDLIILDLMLPDMTGENVLQYLSQASDYPNVLILSARNQVQDKTSLFRKGCDDYLTKPFVFDELLVRVQALLRRPRRIRSQGLNIDGLNLDLTTYEASLNDTRISLTPKEAAFLKILLQEPGRIISRREILKNVWGLKEEPSANYVGIHLFNLRKKLALLGREHWLQTIRGTGYVWYDSSVKRFGH